MNLLDKMILKRANKILIKKGGKELVDGVYILRMPVGLKEWLYKKGYNIYSCEPNGCK
jgi:hypothetical protein